MNERFRIINLLILIVATLIPACESGDAHPAARKNDGENILRYDVSCPFQSMNPLASTPSGSLAAFPFLYDYLVTPGEGGGLEPDLAARWSYDPGRRTWTIGLRDGVQFHDGRPVGAKDAIYSLKTDLNRSNPSVASLIEGMHVLSDTVFEIVLKKDDPDFLARIASVNITPDDSAGKIDYYEHPIGSGPFQFSYRKKDNEVALVANDDYFLGRPALDGVVLHYEKDRERSWARLLAEKTDIAQEIYPKDYEMIKKYEGRFHFAEKVLEYYSLLLYNTADPLFRDPQVRQAMSCAVDVRYIVDKILMGFGVPAEGPLGVQSPYCDADARPVPFDPHRSLALLAKAGWTYDEATQSLSKEGKRFEFTILIFEGNQMDRNVAEYLQLCFNEIGMVARIQSLPYNEVLRRYMGARDFQAVLTEFKGAYLDPEGLQAIWSPRPGGCSYGGCFEDPQITTILQDAFSGEDPLRRKELLTRFDRLLVSLQPATFLFHKTAFDVMSRRVSFLHPFSLEITGIHRLREAWIGSR